MNVRISKEPLKLNMQKLTVSNKTRKSNSIRKKNMFMALTRQDGSKKEYREVRKVRHLSFRSAAATLSGKKKELVAKEEAKYQLAFENEQRSKRELDQFQSRYDETLTKVKLWKIKKSGSKVFNIFLSIFRKKNL